MPENLKIKTIKIELLEGVPGGFRRAEFTTQMMRVLVVPRDKQDLLEHCPEAKFQAVYLIVGEDENGDPKVYIGQTRRMTLRIKEHNKGGKKEYWQNVLYFVTKDNSLNPTEIEYLEWLLIKKAAEAGNYRIDNGNKGRKSEPAVEPAKRADFTDYYNQIVALSEVLGYGDIFNPIHLESIPHEKNYFCESPSNGVKAEMVLREDGYYVLAGARCAPKLSDAAHKSEFIVNTRKRLKQNGIIVQQGDSLVFPQDYRFQTPSGAATAIYGRSMNGWTTWKNLRGRTLDEELRQTSKK